MKLSIENLVVEVTRRCNMHCAHCMRGPAQNKDLDLEAFDTFAENVESIGVITFSGGEPTLNISAIQHVLETCKRLNILVYNFYLVTNGKQMDDSFLKVMIDWYVYCYECGGDPELLGVAVSFDKYHEAADPQVVAKLKALSFFNDTDKRTDFDKVPLINLGNAKTLSGKKREPDHYGIYVETYEDDGLHIYDSNITFTVDGDILSDCDYEYENTDGIKICDYNNIDEFLNT